MYGILYKTNFMYNSNNKILPQMICLVVLCFYFFLFFKVGVFML